MILLIGALENIFNYDSKRFSPTLLHQLDALQTCND